MDTSIISVGIDFIDLIILFEFFWKSCNPEKIPTLKKLNFHPNKDYMYM